MKMLISGSWVDAADGATINVTNPCNSKLLDTVPNAAKEDIDRAIADAAAAQKQWNRVIIRERAKILRKYLELLTKHRDDLAKTLTLETGKPIFDSYGEIDSVYMTFESSIEIAFTLLSVPSRNYTPFSSPAAGSGRLPIVQIGKRFFELVIIRCFQRLERFDTVAAVDPLQLEHALDRRENPYFKQRFDHRVGLALKIPRTFHIFRVKRFHEPDKDIRHNRKGAADRSFDADRKRREQDFVMPIKYSLISACPDQRLRLHKIHGRLLDAGDPLMCQQFDQFSCFE